MWHFFQTKIVENSRSKPAETSCPGTTFSDNHQKNSVIPSAVKFVEWNTEAAIFSNAGCWRSKTIVQNVPVLSVLVQIAADTLQYNSLELTFLKKNW